MEKKNLLKMFFESKKDSEWKLIYQDQQIQLENEFQEWIDSKNGSLLPDEVDTKDEHEQYLKDIRYDEYIKKIQHFYDSSIGLWAFDCEPKELLNKFNASQSDAHCLVVEDFEKLLKDWERFCNNENYFKSPFFQLGK